MLTCAPEGPAGNGLHPRPAGRQGGRAASCPLAQLPRGAPCTFLRRPGPQLGFPDPSPRTPHLPDSTFLGPWGRNHGRITNHLSPQFLGGAHEEGGWGENGPRAAGATALQALTRSRGARTGTHRWTLRNLPLEKGPQGGSQDPFPAPPALPSPLPGTAVTGTGLAPAPGKEGLQCALSVEGGGTGEGRGCPRGFSGSLWSGHRAVPRAEADLEGHHQSPVDPSADP